MYRWAFGRFARNQCYIFWSRPTRQGQTSGDGGTQSHGSADSRWPGHRTLSEGLLQTSSSRRSRAVVVKGARIMLIRSMNRRNLAIVLFLLLFARQSICQAGPTRGGPLPQPLPIFPKDNWWNTDISSAPVDRNSASYINFIGVSRGLHPDLGGDACSGIYGMPYITVAGDQPLEQVVFDYADESDYAAPGRPSGYPIPLQARTETKWIEGGLAGNDAAASGDRHMLILDRDHRILFELYAARWNTTRNRWEAGSGAIFPLDSNQRRQDGWTSADAAGLAIFPGLLRYDEAYASQIQHALRVTVRATNGYVFPASHRAGNTSGALPMGARLRLKAGKDISGYPQALQRIFNAMKRYGLIVADNGSDMYVSGTYDTHWDNAVLNPAFSSLKAGDFEVVQLGWQPSQTPSPCSPPSVTVQPASVTIAPDQTAILSLGVSSSMPYFIQWFTGIANDVSSPFAGAGSSSLNVSPSATTSYWARAENVCGSYDTDTATVTVTTGSAPVGTRFYTLTPCRLIDTRESAGETGGPALASGSVRSVSAAGRCGIPATATSLSINVTVVPGQAAGFLTVYPGGSPLPATSSINFSRGKTRANNAVVQVSTDSAATFAVFNGGPESVNFIIDVNGFFQ